MRITDFCTFGLGTLLFLLPLLPGAQDSLSTRWNKMVSGGHDGLPSDKR